MYVGARAVQNEVPLFIGRPYDFTLAHKRILNSSCPSEIMEAWTWARISSVLQRGVLRGPRGMY
eukprot:7013390-Heterocapsa_arctica.AAC.1